MIINRRTTIFFFEGLKKYLSIGYILFGIDHFKTPFKSLNPVFILFLSYHFNALVILVYPLAH